MAKRERYYTGLNIVKNPVSTKNVPNEEARLKKIKNFMKNIEKDKAKKTANELARRALRNVAANRGFVSNTKRYSMLNGLKAFGRRFMPTSNPNERTAKQKRLEERFKESKKQADTRKNTRRANHEKNLKNAFKKLQTAKNKIGNVGLNVNPENVEAFEKAYKKYKLLKQDFKGSYNQTYNAHKFNEGFINDFYKASEGRRAARTQPARNAEKAREWARTAGLPPLPVLTPKEKMALSLWGLQPDKENSQSNSDENSESELDENSESELDENSESELDEENSNDEEELQEAKNAGFNNVKKYKALKIAAKGRGQKAERAQAELNSAYAKVTQTELPGQLKLANERAARKARANNAMNKARALVAAGEAAREARRVATAAAAAERAEAEEQFKQKLLRGAL